MGIMVYWFDGVIINVGVIDVGKGIRCVVGIFLC